MVLSTRSPSWFNGRVTQLDSSTVQKWSRNFWICAPVLRNYISRKLFSDFLPTLHGYRWHVAVNNLDYPGELFCYFLGATASHLGSPGLRHLLTSVHLLGLFAAGQAIIPQRAAPLLQSHPSHEKRMSFLRICLSSGGLRCNNYVSLTGDLFVKKHVPLELLFLLMSCHAKRFQEGGVFLL